MQTRYQREHVDEDVVVDFHHESVCMYKEQRVSTLHPQHAYNDQLIDVDYDYDYNEYYADLLSTVATVDRLKQHGNKLFEDQGNDLRSLDQAFTSTSILQFRKPTLYCIKGPVL